MQSNLDKELNSDSAATYFVTWGYIEHPSRWVVAAIAFAQAAVLSMGFFSGNLQPINSTQPGSGYFVFTWIGEVFLLGFIAICLRPRVNGCFARRGNQFELDSGRRAPDFLSALTFWSGWITKPQSFFTVDLIALGSEYSARFFPRRHKIIGQINEIGDITLETAVLGPKIVLHLKSGIALSVVEDVPAEELTRVYENIQGLIYTNIQQGIKR